MSQPVLISSVDVILKYREHVAFPAVDNYLARKGGTLLDHRIFTVVTDNDGDV